MSGCDRELNARFYSAASLKYHDPEFTKSTFKRCLGAFFIQVFLLQTKTTLIKHTILDLHSLPKFLPRDTNSGTDEGIW